MLFSTDALGQGHRVDVHGPAVGHGHALQEALKVPSPEYQVPPEPASHPLREGRSGAHHLYVCQPDGVGPVAQKAAHSLGFPLAGGGVGVHVDHVDEPAEGGVTVLRAVSDLVVVQAAVILARGGHQGVAGGVVRLDYGFARRLPAGPPRHLADELKGPFRRPKVGDVEANVRQHHPYQGYPRHVQSLGHHLGADEDLGLSSKEPFQGTVVGVRDLGCVSVPPQGRDTGEEPGELIGHPLSTQAQVPDPGASTLRAAAGGKGPAVAAVAQQPHIYTVVGQGY